jgi:hypothetical protein
MKILLKTITFSFFLLLSNVQAQNYYGVAGAFTLAGFPAFPVGLQGGDTDVLPDFGVRFTLDTAFIAITLGVDALYTATLESAQIYVGGGPELTLGGPRGDLFLGVRATGGLELRQDKVGFFAELQPFITTGQTSGVRLRIGLNLYLQE